MKTTSFLFGVAALAALLCSSVCAEKIAVDPYKNGGSTTSREKPGPDLRLAQKITYTSVGNRLHTVLEELSKQSDVNIQAGENADDWRVRDLPVAIYVKDVPLGYLLRSIAYSLHLSYASFSIKNEKRYRIWRDSKRHKQIDEYLAEIEAFGKDLASDQWDAWVKLGNAADLDKKTDNIKIKAMAKVFVGFTAEQKKTVMDGGALRLTPKTVPAGSVSAFRALYQAMWDDRLARDERMAADYPRRFINTDLTDNMMNSVELIVGLYNGDYGMCFTTDSPWLPVSYRDLETFNLLFDMPPYPEMALELLGESPDERTKPVPPAAALATGFRKLDVAGDCSGLGLDAKITFKRPKNGDQPTIEELLTQLSKACGYSFIIEDFMTHQAASIFDSVEFDTEMTIDSVLNNMSFVCDIDWFIDPTRKLLIGSRCKWWEDHSNLVPEKTVLGLTAKLDSTGVELDDLAPVMFFSEGQRAEWIIRDKNLSILWYRIPERQLPFWQLYTKLSNDEKALAKSNEGLPLSKSDRKRVIAAFEEHARIAGEDNWMQKLFVLQNQRSFKEQEVIVGNWLHSRYPQTVNLAMGQIPDIDLYEVYNAMLNAFPEMKAALATPTDVSTILKLKLRVNKSDVSTSSVLIPGKPKPHAYSMSIQGDDINLDIQPIDDLQFPVYSEKRFNELIAEQKKKSEKKEPK
ncbi:MAG: hypothetical protein NT018_12900 [Armatimonadetes bacterium]|nr:hypothetical protein [Armatimonadota bacterium]